MIESSNILGGLACGAPNCACAESVRKGRGNTHCPVHEDPEPSLSVDVQHRKVLVHCHGGCSQASVIKELKHRHLWPTFGVTLEEYARAKGLPIEFLKSLGLHDASRNGKPAVAMPYLSESGQLVHKRHRVALDGAIKVKAPSGGQLIPYGLNRLAEARKRGYAVLVEGESDSQTLWLHEEPALGIPGNNWKPEWDKYLEGIPTALVVLEPGSSGVGMRRSLARSNVAGRVQFISLAPHKDPNELHLAGPTEFKERWAQAVAAAKPWTAEERSTELGVVANSDRQYAIRRGCTVWNKPTFDGVTEVVLANFSASITAEKVKDDGIESSLFLDLAGALKTGPKLPLVTIPAREFPGMNWVIGQWGSAAIIEPGAAVKDHLRAAIQSLSTETLRQRLFTHSGWREIDDEMVYLHGGGAIGANSARSDVSVELPGDLGRLELPLPPTGDDLRASVRSALTIWQVAPDVVSIPLFASAWRAPLGDADFTVHLVGPSGSGKTELAALVQQHYGGRFDSRHLPGSWSSTANANEALAFAAKDAVFVIDDFAPAGTINDVQRLNRDAERLIRAQGNTSGRARMRADTSLRPPKPPRSLLLSTGEDVPGGLSSLLARMVTIEVELGTVNWDQLTAAQSVALKGDLAGALAGYLAWLAPQMAKMGSRLREQVAARRQQLKAQHRRSSDAMASLALGIDYFLAYALGVGAITVMEADDHRRRADLAFESLLKTQDNYQQSVDPVLRYQQILEAALAAGEAHIAGPDGSPPKGATGLGWREYAGTNALVPQGRRIGWIRDDGLYLEGDAAYEVARRFGSDFIITRRALHKSLDQRHLIRSRDGSRFTVRAIFQGKRQHVVHMPSDFLGAIEVSAPPERPTIEEGRF